MKIVSFVDEAKEKVIQKLLDVSGTGECTRETVQLKTGKAYLAVIRGGSIEKASVTHLVLDQLELPGVDEALDHMVFQTEIFPENPYCPMGHFNTEWAMTESGPFHMNLDLFPAVTVEEDLNRTKLAMDRVAEQFGLDKAGMRKGLDEHYNMAHFDAPLATKVGCKLLDLKEEHLDLFITAYHTFFDSYIEILKNRKDTPFSADDNNLKLKRNAKWLEYIALKDRAIRMGLDSGIPPEVIIKLSFPPSAVF